jgi:hypothetical protein
LPSSLVFEEIGAMRCKSGSLLVLCGSLVACGSSASSTPADSTAVQTPVTAPTTPVAPATTPAPAANGVGVTPSATAAPAAVPAAGGAAALPVAPAAPAQPMAAVPPAAAAPLNPGASTMVSTTAPTTVTGQDTPDPPGTVMIQSDPFMLQAGQEIYKCQNFDNPFGGGADTAIQKISADMSTGSHHMHLYHMTTSATRTLEDCDESDFHPLMFTAGTPHTEITYPAGMATKLAGTTGVRIQLHYLSTADTNKMVNATIKLSPVDYSTVTKWVSELYFNQLNVHVAPGTNQVISTTCSIPSNYGQIGLVVGSSHMHKRGTHFTAQTSTGVMLTDVNTWDEPPSNFYDPPIMMSPGDKITWTCTYDNETGRTLTFGESAENNEMCIFLARFYSAPDGSQLECQATGATGVAAPRTM